MAGVDLLEVTVLALHHRLAIQPRFGVAGYLECQDNRVVACRINPSVGIAVGRGDILVVLPVHRLPGLFVQLIKVDCV